MSAHLIDGEFQSDRYPTTPRGKVPLSCKDPTAQDLLWEYAQRRRVVDAEFSDDLETALQNAGFCADGPSAADTLEEMFIFHYGTPAEVDDQRNRWVGLSTTEIASAIENDARRLIAKHSGPSIRDPKEPNQP